MSTDEPKSNGKTEVISEEEKFVSENDPKNGYSDVKEAIKRTKALADAKEATEKFGATSPEARLAWELVEELAATDSHHKATGSG